MTVNPRRRASEAMRADVDPDCNTVGDFNRKRLRVSSNGQIKAELLELSHLIYTSLFYRQMVATPTHSNNNEIIENS